MKKNILNIIAVSLLLATGIIRAQVTTSSAPSPILAGTNYFLDASLYQQKPASEGKILGFPISDLTKFKFNMNTIDNLLTEENYFDGVLIYNGATGSTLTAQGKSTGVTPGFYYFSNPGKPSSVMTGQWKKVGSVDYVDGKENGSNVIIEGSPVYSFKGKFEADGTKTKHELSDITPEIAKGIGTIFKVTIYSKENGVYTNSVYSFDAATRSLVTGSPNMSVVYKPGEYKYILEYLKDVTPTP